MDILNHNVINSTLYFMIIVTGDGSNIDAVDDVPPTYANAKSGSWVGIFKAQDSCFLIYE